jgi:hypothetical protein
VPLAVLLKRKVVMLFGFYQSFVSTFQRDLVRTRRKHEALTTSIPVMFTMSAAEEDSHAPRATVLIVLCPLSVFNVESTDPKQVYSES